MTFQIGPLTVHLYGVILMLGAVAAAYLASREAQRRGLDPDYVWDALTYVITGGVIGARLWHILTPPPSMVAMGITPHYYLTHPLEAIAVWKGGLGIPGAVMGGGLALYLYLKVKQRHLPPWKRTSFAQWADVAAPGVALGQAIGRWGNYVNQELYGAPTNLPWKLYIDPQHRLPGYENIAYYHPLFLYESIWNLLNMGLLLWVARRYERRLRQGDVFLLYLMVYAVGRFFLEYLRLDASRIGTINANQTLMALVGLGAAALFLARHSRWWPRPAQEAPQPKGKRRRRKK